MAAPRPASALPEISLLREMFIYDPATGELMWRQTGRGRRVDRRIICVCNGYLVVSVGQVRNMLVHRVIWAMVYGYWPTEVDHRNGTKTDNSLDNLRDCSHQNNCRNSSAKRQHLKGAHLHKRSGLYRSSIKVGERTVYLGYFKTDVEAHAAYCSAADIYFGEYARAA